MAEEEKKKGFFKEFKEFISKGNVLDLAVGVIIGGAFNVIVTALVNILLSLATFWIPGGLAGMVYALPAVKDSQRGIEGSGQSFAAGALAAMTEKFAQSQGQTTTTENFPAWQQALLGQYEKHGDRFYFKGAALVDVGAFINAIITFILIALTLFVIVKVSIAVSKRRAALKAKLEAEAKAKLGKGKKEAEPKE